jgi:serine/threonine protein phosphatase PrpC
MHNSQLLSDLNTTLDPVEILQMAYSQILEKQEVEAGSATACILSFVEQVDPSSAKVQPLLFYANLGDSGFRVIRSSVDTSDEPLIFRSKEQQQKNHFNAPFQLGVIPKSMIGECYTNLPSDAARAAVEGIDRPHFSCFSLLMLTQPSLSLLPFTCHFFSSEVKPGDIIVLATDGLFDNVFDSQIVDLVEEVLAEEITKSANSPLPNSNTAIFQEETDRCQKIANALVKKAREGAADDTWDSPFAKNAKAAGNFFFRGGKWCVAASLLSLLLLLLSPHSFLLTTPLLLRDDVTVVVAIVAKNPSVVREAHV